jgi:putative ATPase
VVSSHKKNEVIITNELVSNSAQSNPILYDKTGEQHYDIVSAFIKSIRGSDPNAAVYWLARMIEGGEDPKFIARRMIILSSEDIGNANPTALVIANNCFQAVIVIGMPESRIVLAQTATYLACSQKSNASYMAINYAQETVKETGNLSVPLKLRNAPTALMKKMHYGEEYEYSHNYQNNFVFQDYMPEKLSNHTLYIPGENDKEQQFKHFLSQRWKEKYNY